MVYEATCAAEQAVAFAIPFNSGNFVPEPETAVLTGPDVLRGMVRELRTRSGNSRFTWHQDTTTDGEPFSPKISETTEPFSDGSELRVLIRTDPPPSPLRMFEIALSLYVTPTSGSADTRHIEYCLDTGSATVTRHEDNTYGLSVSGIKTIAEQLVAAHLDQTQLEDHLAAALTEVSIERAGLDPTIDPHVEALRAADEVYRGHSDAARNDRENRDLAVMMGAINDQPVGATELIALGKLLLSL
jgi:hypothetical protein